MSTLAFALEIIVHTPLWVWAVLAYLIFVGIKSSRDHEVAGARVFIVPAIITLLALSHVFADEVTAIKQVALALGLVLGVLVGYWRHRSSGARVIAPGRLFLKGSWGNMIVLMTIFAIRYVSNVMAEVAPETAASVPVTATTTAISGFLMGMSISLALLRLRLASTTTQPSQD